MSEMTNPEQLLPCYAIGMPGEQPVAVGVSVIAAWNAAEQTLGGTMGTLKRMGYTLVEGEWQTRARPEQPTDTERLDWLENYIHDRNGSLTIGFQSHDYLLKEFGGKMTANGGELREAIDAAMKSTESEAGK